MGGGEGCPAVGGGPPAGGAGVGAAGTACAKILMRFGVKNIIGCDRQGVLSRSRDYGENIYKHWFAHHTNPENSEGKLYEQLQNCDFFLGLAGPGVVTTDHLRQMNNRAIVFALANPVPEIYPEEVPENVSVVATGRSDYPNQINNVICFPGLFRGVLDVRASEINEEMNIAAAEAIAGSIPDNNLSEDFIIPNVFDKQVPRRVSQSVSRAAHDSGVARRSRRSGQKIYSPFRLR